MLYNQRIARNARLSRVFTGGMGLGASGGGTGPITTLLKDNFVDTTGTNLTAHAMNVGPGWSVLVGGAAIQSNSAEGTAAGDNAMASDAGMVNGTATGIATIASDGGGAGLVCRAQTGTVGFYLFYVDHFGGIQILEYAAGAFTQRAVASFTAGVGTAINLKLTNVGNTMTGVATSNGSGNTSGPITIAYTSTLYNANTKWGFYVNAINSAAFNSFLVTNP